METIAHFDNAYGDFQNALTTFIVEHKLVKILEIGGGANPYLTENFVKKHGIEYAIADIDQEELDKAEGDYFTTHCLNIGQEETELSHYDLAFSHMVLEHLDDPATFHKALQKILRPGAYVFHFFATKYGIPSLVNLLLPDFLTDRLLFLVQKRNPEKEGKFKAYYRWCLGPTQKNIKRIEDTGFSMLTYRGYIGHGYFSRFKYFYTIEKGFGNLLLAFKSPYFCSVAYFTAQKISP